LGKLVFWENIIPLMRDIFLLNDMYLMRDIKKIIYVYRYG